MIGRWQGLDGKGHELHEAAAHSHLVSDSAAKIAVLEAALAETKRQLKVAKDHHRAILKGLAKEQERHAPR